MPKGFVIRLLGLVQIEHGGSAVRGFESRKALALICYLAAQGQPVSRARLANLFWGNLDEKKGRANLSRVLHNNALLLPGVTEIMRGEVSFSGGPTFELDASEFAQLTAAGDLASLTAAAALYRGEFMDGAYLDGCPEFETWLVTQQEVWRQRMARLLGRLIAAHTEHGDYDAGLAYAQRLLALDNWREEAHRQVMLLQALTGQRSAALAQYQVCRQVLADELGVEPSQQTRELFERIAAGASNKTSVPSGPRPGITIAQPAASRPILTPRDHDKKLAQIAARLCQPACRLLVLTGAMNAHRADLATQAASHRASALRHGCCEIKLDATVASEGLSAALAEALHLPWTGAGSARRRLFTYLDDKEMLLLIRNLQPQNGAVGLVEDILKRAPGVQILVTAPQPLDVCGEWVVEVEG